MNKLEEEDNKRQTLRKQKEKQDTYKGTKLENSRQGVQEITWQLFYSSKGQEKMKITKRPFDVAVDVYWVLRVCQGVC